VGQAGTLHFGGTVFPPSVGLRYLSSLLLLGNWHTIYNILARLAATLCDLLSCFVY
jgi:hypothetical protein